MIPISGVTSPLPSGLREEVMGPGGEDGTDSPLGDIDAPRPAFLWCGWRTLSVDWLLDKSHDLSNPLRQQSLHDQLSSSCSPSARATLEALLQSLRHWRSTFRFRLLSDAWKSLWT